MIESQVVVDVARGHLASADGDDHSLRAHLAVAAHEHVVERTHRLQAVVRLEVGAVCLHARLFERRALDVLPHGDEHHVGRHAHKRLVGLLRSRAAALHGADELRLSVQCHRAPVFDLDMVGCLQGHHLDAFLHGGVDFRAQRRHVLEAATIGDRHARGAGTHARARAVHGDVAATDDHHVLAREVGIVAIADLGEQVDGAHDALGVGPIEL